MRAGVVEVRLLADRAERGDGEVGAIERLEHERARAHLELVVLV